MVVPKSRVSLLLALADLPEDAWDALVVWARAGAVIAAAGDFAPESAEALRTVAAAAEAYRTRAPPTTRET